MNTVHNIDSMGKYFSGLLFSFTVSFKTTIPFIGVLLFVVFLDCFTAWRLSIRVKRRYPKKASGKFQSNRAFKVVIDSLEAYFLIFLLQLVDDILLGHLEPFHLANWGAAFFCFLQGWSIFENMSSESGVWWARILQKVMVSKASRHFDIDPDIFTNTSNNQDETN